jgi:Transposase, Mutator family
MPTGRCQRPPAWPSFTFADGDLRADRNRGSARPARGPGRQGDGVEEQDTAGLSAPHLAADALIASVYLAGTNTRRVRRPLAALFGGAVGKDTVSRVWRKVKADWEAWNARSLLRSSRIRTTVPSRISRTILRCNWTVI